MTAVLAVSTPLAMSGVLPVRADEAPHPAATPVTASMTPDASDPTFDQPQAQDRLRGSTFTYGHLRRPGIGKGPSCVPVEDAVTLKVEPGESIEARDISVTMFAGFRCIPTGPSEGMTESSVVGLFLENYLDVIAGVLGANPCSLKLAIRRVLRDRASVAPTWGDLNGREVCGRQIVARSFGDDSMKTWMRGLDGLTYTFVVSSAVLGEIVSMEASAETTAGGESLERSPGYAQTAG